MTNLSTYELPPFTASGTLSPADYELYPHYGQPSGLRDAWGYELEFPSAFRLSRSGKPRGIVRLVREASS